MESIQLVDAAGAVQHQAIRHPGMGLCLHPFLFQGFLQIIPGCFQGIYLNDGLRGGVVRLQYGFQHSLRHIGFQQGDQCLRVAVFVLIRGGLQELALGPDGAAKNAVDQPRLTLGGIFLRQNHRLVDGGAVRHPVQVVDLVEPQMQDIPGGRVEGFQFPLQQLLQIEVQPAPVLQDPVAQPGSQGRFPSVQPVPPDGVLQHGIGPASLTAAGNEGAEGRFPCPHQSFRGWPRK